ncbi:MAG: hypothetical protein DIU70_007960 [Bacillota bacterium]
MPLPRGKAVPLLSLAALPLIVVTTAALLRGYGPKAPAVESPEPADLLAILTTAPPHIPDLELYDEASARSVVERAETALNLVDPKDAEDLSPRFALMLQNARRDLATAREMLSQGDYAQAVRLGSHAEAVAQGLAFIIEAEHDPQLWHRANVEERLAVLTRKLQEQEAAARKLESTISTVHDYLLLVSIENHLRDGLPEQVAAHWEAARMEANPLQAQRLAVAALGELTLLEDDVRRVDGLLAQLPGERHSEQAPVSARLAAWAAGEIESVLAVVGKLQSLYPEDTTQAYRALLDARYQAEAAREDLAAGWVARAWGLAVSARADLESVPYLAVLPTQTPGQKSAVALDDLADVRARALHELVATSQLKAPGSNQPITDFLWFNRLLTDAAEHIRNGDAILRRYSEDPAPAAWPGTSQDAYFEYVQAFTAARRAQLAYDSLAAAGLD